MERVSKKDIYEVHCIICPKCENQIELDSKYQKEVDCPFCDETIEIVDD